jgi:hypothetical protein
MPVLHVTRIFLLSVLMSIFCGISGSVAQQDTNAQAQEATPADESNPSSVQPMGEWLEFRQARYVDKPILLHLRSGYERAVLMPERIGLLDDGQSLPGCAVVIDTDVVGFYPTRTFKRTPIKFVGLETGKIYELRVRASPEGMRQPLQITR